VTRWEHREYFDLLLAHLEKGDWQPRTKSSRRTRSAAVLLGARIVHVMEGGLSNARTGTRGEAPFPEGLFRSAEIAALKMRAVEISAVRAVFALLAFSVPKLSLPYLPPALVPAGCWPPVQRPGALALDTYGSVRHAVVGRPSSARSRTPCDPQGMTPPRFLRGERRELPGLPADSFALIFLNQSS